MEYIKRAKNPINSLILFVLSSAFSLGMGFGFKLITIPSVFLSVIFMVMVIEDYIYMEIDLRLVAALCAAGLWASNFSPGEYLYFLVFGLIYFRIVYLSLIKYFPENQEKAVSELKEKIIPYAAGFLPAVACSLIIYSFYLYEAGVSYGDLIYVSRQEGQYMYGAFINYPASILFIIVPLIIIWVYLENKLRKAKRNKLQIFPRIGEGDGYVFAVWMAIIGFGDMLIVSVLSAFIQCLVLLFKRISK